MRARNSGRPSMTAYRQSPGIRKKPNIQKQIDLDYYFQNKKQTNLDKKDNEKTAIKQQIPQAKYIPQQKDSLLLHSNRIYNAPQPNKNSNSNKINSLRNSLKIIIKQETTTKKINQKRPCSSRNQKHIGNQIIQHSVTLPVNHRPGSSKSSRLFRKKTQGEDKINSQNQDTNIMIKVTNKTQTLTQKSSKVRAGTSLSKGTRNNQSLNCKLDPQFFRLFAQ